MSHNKNHLESQRFGRLLVLHESAARYRSGHTLWICQCDCGAVVQVAGHNLRSGQTTSCGCYHVDISHARRYPLMRCVRVNGEALRAARDNAGMHQATVAELARVGEHIISECETGRSRWMHPDVLGAIALALGVESATLVADGDPEPGRRREGES